jgi:predicted helicase
MPINSTGVKTHRDHFVLDFDQSSLRTRIEDFRNLNISDEEVREKYNLPDTRDWKLSERRRSLAVDSQWENHFTKCLYRPFDFRHYYHSRDVVELPRHEVMQHMFDGKNMGFCTNRQVNGKFRHILCSRQIINDCTVSLATRERTYLFPLYLYTGTEKSGDKYIHQQALDNTSWLHGPNGRVPNLNSEFVTDLESCLDLAFVSDGIGDLASTFGPEDIFHYIYAVFHSPTYRLRYAEFLKMDFPRVPLTSNVELFRTLCALGKELVGLHLLESSKLEVSKLSTHYPIKGDNTVEKGYPRYDNQLRLVRINKTQYLEGVPNDVWEFHIGGYQVCEKWLKDRRGRQLSYDDITHYRMIIAALKETIRLMEEIDKAIPEWPIK